MTQFEQRDKAEQLDAWERGLAQYAHRSDSSGYAGRMGLELLAELRASATVLRAITLGHPMVCPIVSMGARVALGRN